ncbi:alpha-L-fucosidase-like [Rhopilema esculentum]|uniref:alpha-L-fucosidase-like n=1 Tax=Rhopilema esculentum TaxID=499914 RepID=UPI0031DB12DB|eukprot:gene9626-17385_t
MDMRRVWPVLAALLIFLFVNSYADRFEPTWESLDKHQGPAWFDEAKVGLFVHWGVYSVPAFGTDGVLGEWFWWAWRGEKRQKWIDFMKKNYRPGFQYEDFAPQFRAEMFDADKWIDIFNASGAKYFIITSKHHDGFTNWKSNISWNWNSVDTGPHRDIIAELSSKIRSKTDIKFCLYHSLFEWFHPLFLKDKSNGFQTLEYPKTILLPQLYDMVNTFKPHYIWSDGDWDAGSDYWQSKEFLAWLYNDSPVKDDILVNDRWGKDANCKHGDVKTCGRDRFDPGKLLSFKWENDMTIDHYSWGFRRNAPLSDYLTVKNLTDLLAETISCGGNLVMNIGPTADGRITPIYEERLRGFGAWLKVNGEGVYATKPWRKQNDTVTPGIWYVTKDSNVYAFVLEWPENDVVFLSDPVASFGTKVTMLGLKKDLLWMHKSGQAGMEISLKNIRPQELPCHHTWVLKLHTVT